MPPEVIKVCGITGFADALFAAQHGATALGFVFFAGSPRYVRVETAAMISAAVPKDVLRVGVFVDERPSQILNVKQAVNLDVVQLHGDETPEVCRALGELRVWKAFRVRPYFALQEINEYPCEAFLLDGASEEGSHGGSGRTFPWPTAQEAKRHGRIIVAGGLDGGNVGEAIRQVDPWGVDASSRLERRPGVKDPEKVRQYLEAACPPR